ncbi:MAG: glutathione peroxidase [Myxococcota bacterium]|nr:glutathione peroxidase [Myxococcota bacterium]
MSLLNYSHEVTQIDGSVGDLSAYQGEVLLIVNTASECGLTPQFEGLQKLHETYGDQGLRVLGFPCNQFGAQEPGEASEIQSFCQRNYGVSFTMHDKVKVNGGDAHPLFVQLKEAAKGALGTQAIKWNFGKFLVARDGSILKRFAPTKTPLELSSAIEGALKS